MSRIFNGVEVLEGNKTNINNISNICADSRKCVAGSLFVAVIGVDADGHNFIGKAIENGATTIVCEHVPSEYKCTEVIKGNEKGDNVEFITVKNSRKSLAHIAANFYGNPSKELKLVGVTGTNGKTTIATLLYNLFTKLGYSCGLLSTIANYVGETRYETINTTPGPIELNELLAKMVESGCEYCFMEVSSHAVSQDRIEGLEFTGGLFTNLTHDHLDYHKTFANYLACKKLFFDELPPTAFALTNVDDKNGMVMTQNTKAEIFTYSTRNIASFKCKIIEKSIEGMLLNINGTEVWCRFIGAYNAANLTVVYGAAILLGADEDEVLSALSQLTSVSGRLEYFRGANDIIAAVDYAHTPDALENVLKTLKELEPQGDLICVFGCGGNRDKSKRPKMGAIAAKYANRVIVTSDNPRDEEPNDIMNDIREGMDIKARAKSLFISDRTEAIRTAVLTAKEGSMILVAGKGHEDYQIIKGVKHHLDDKEIIKEAFLMLN